MFTLLLPAVIVLTGGLMRGVTGFGGAMFMTPPLSVIVGARQAVVYALLLEAAAAIVMIPQVAKHVELRTVALLSAPAVACLPLGGLLLITADPHTLKTVIATIVCIFCAVMLCNGGHHAKVKPLVLALVGAAGGALCGATSMGGPPAILYLLYGPTSAGVTRANLVIYVSILSILGLIVPALSGIITASVLATALILVTPYLGGTWIGTRIFSRLTDHNFKRAALLLMMGAGVLGLVL